MTDETSTLLERVIAQDAALLELYRITVLESGEGTCTLQASPRPELVNSAGVTHGSLAFPLADTAAAYAMASRDLHAVTINAAEFMGLDDRVGSLEVGKQATLLVTTGNPLDTTSDIEQAFIQGRELDMNDIQKHFFEKYMTKVMQRMRVIS